MTTLLPCPFCGSHSIDPEGWASTDRAGPACDECAGTADTVELWNSRTAPAGLVHEFVRDYSFEFGDGRSYTPTEQDRAMLEDAIEGYIAAVSR